ncbi:hypothetical protein Ddye_030593, partial [Dipteronia dyeriana]
FNGELEMLTRPVSPTQPLLLLLCIPFDLASNDYGQALTQNIFFFEAQRFGYFPHNQRITWRSNSGPNDGIDLLPDADEEIGGGKGISNPALK